MHMPRVRLIPYTYVNIPNILITENMHYNTPGRMSRYPLYGVRGVLIMFKGQVD